MNTSSYFTVTGLDKTYYEEKLKNRLPQIILDAHTHMCLPEHVSGIPQSRIDSDWALQGGFVMSVEEAKSYAAALFPGKDYRFTVLPMVVKEADTEGNNDYIAELIRNKKISFGALAVRPETEPEKIEARFKAEAFVGLKPYPDFVSAFKGAEVSIFDFLPRSHLALAERLGKCIILHLPRAGRLADPNNIRELRQIASEFPRLKIVIAHLGRCFNRCYFEKAAEILGNDIHHFWFDTSAVMNPQVHALAMSILREDRIFFGLDWPALLWHGSRRWTETGYTNVCREALPWNKHTEGRAAEAEYTFFIYEQIYHILNTMEELGKDQKYKEGFFYKNGAEFFEKCRDTVTDGAERRNGK
jgi:predicted TIM-barrel fold metal-dependent hydrolase